MKHKKVSLYEMMAGFQVDLVMLAEQWLVTNQNQFMCVCVGGETYQNKKKFYLFINNAL